MTANLCMAYIQYCKAVYGNAYLRKVRGNGGQIVELWPISPALLWPVRTNGSKEFISYYAYQFSASGTIERIPVEDIVHFRVGLDDRNHMLGLSPLAQLIREVDTDQQATAFADRLVRNNAVPGLVVTVPVEAGDIGKENADILKERLQATFGGDGQGFAAVLTGGATAAPYGFSPEQLNLTGLHRLPEERISAVLGVPAIIAGLGAGLERATYANFKEAREMFIESTIIPAYAEDDAVLTTQLLPEFTADPALSLKHEITNMRALQPDMDALYARVTLAVGNKPWLAINEARTEAGFPTVEGQDEIAQPEPPPDMTPPDEQGAEDEDMPMRPNARSVKRLNRGEFEAALLAMRTAHERELANALTTYFRGLRMRMSVRMREAA
jgi:HK97 family phage portal protein